VRERERERKRKSFMHICMREEGTGKRNRKTRVSILPLSIFVGVAEIEMS
jgi:hypothetical protein